MCVFVCVCVCVCDCVCVCVQVGTLTWTLLNTEGSISVLCPSVVLQLEGRRVVNKRLRALSNACPTVVEVSTGLQTHTHKKNIQHFYSNIHFVQMRITFSHSCLVALELMRCTVKRLCNL